MIRPPVSAGSSAEIEAWYRPPILGTTRYDRVSSAMLALLIAMCVLAGWALAMWLSNLRIIEPRDGGTLISTKLAVGREPDDKSLKVESPADPKKDPSVVDLDDSEPSAELTINQVLDVSQTASRRISNLQSSDKKDGGTQGSREGSDRGPLGDKDGDGARPPHERWFIRFSDRGSLETYAAQLDHFGIELGLFKNKRIELISQLSGERAKHRTLFSGREKRNVMNFSWAGGARKRADVKLFQTKAGIDATTGRILHFYPQKTVQLLVQAEREAAKRPIREIVRTYFTVISSGKGFQFRVIRFNYKTE